VIFERPLLLWLAPFLGLGVTLLAFWARHRRVSAAAAWSASLGNEAKRTGRRSPYLLGLAALLAGVAIAGPRWGLASSSAESRALNVVFVMDISRSMLAQDAEPDRLTRAIRVARRLVQDLSGDRLGLVVFAARVRSPSSSTHSIPTSQVREVPRWAPLLRWPARCCARRTKVAIVPWCCSPMARRSTASALLSLLAMVSRRMASL
jgi:hypothetical protein